MISERFPGPVRTSPASVTPRSTYNPAERLGREPLKLAMMFPGQGSQSVGMLAALATAEPVVGETFDEASARAGL